MAYVDAWFNELAEIGQKNICWTEVAHDWVKWWDCVKMVISHWELECLDMYKLLKKDLLLWHWLVSKGIIQ